MNAKHKIDVGWTMFPALKYPQRMQYFKECFEALNAQFFAGHSDDDAIEVRHVVSSEARQVSPKAKKELAAFCEERSIKLVWHEGKPGLPMNFENLLNNTDAPYFFYMQEDWLADKPIDLAHGVKLLQANTNVNILRYRWVGQPDVNHANGDLDELFRRIKASANWYYAHNPYLANRTGIERLRPIGHKESRVNSKAKKLRIGVAIRIPSMFKHIGGKSVMTPNKKRPVER